MLIKATAEMIICNSNLSEISSRMTAMDAATRNGNKLITSLSLKKNKLRQAKITNELIDIVSGANAI
jgi:ATP synthase F1 gamma subunit